MTNTDDFDDIPYFPYFDFFVFRILAFFALCLLLKFVVILLLKNLCREFLPCDLSWEWFLYFPLFHVLVCWLSLFSQFNPVLCLPICGLSVLSNPCTRRGALFDFKSLSHRRRSACSSLVCVASMEHLVVWWTLCVRRRLSALAVWCYLKRHLARRILVLFIFFTFFEP